MDAATVEPVGLVPCMVSILAAGAHEMLNVVRLSPVPNLNRGSPL
jgi:hypothetical protein